MHFFCPSLDIGDIRYNNGRYKRYNRRYNNKINRLHKPILRIVYKDYKSSFAELPSEDKSFAVHHKNVQKLAIEMYQAKNELCPKLC